MLVDTHCHLDFPEFDQDRDGVILRAKEKGITSIINIGSSLNGSRKSVELAACYEPVYAAVGIHPHDADTAGEEAVSLIRALAGKSKVVAIGEIGLDYYKNYSRTQNQYRLFSGLASLAKELNLPMVIHNRQASDDTIAVLKPLLPHKIVMHCFAGDESFLKHILDLGFFVSFTCNITYKKAAVLRELVKTVPLERMFLETDAPFLSPEGYRGRRNEPMYIDTLAEEVARIKGIRKEDVARATTENATAFFNLQ
ncbi:MAG: TatD family deoxyribonuclease [Candidatus Omnitrophota bacterium]|jgi:TatD DNase family protein|nr:MAG: TatD family deoxyribonuclease [Candidatus Omnitrophota bacterium]